MATAALMTEDVSARPKSHVYLCILNIMHPLCWTALSTLSAALSFFYSMVSLVDNLYTYLRWPPKPLTTQRAKIPATTNSDPQPKRALTPILSTPQPPAPNTPQHKSAIPQLYALVIGINEYPNLPHLTGAVSDADSLRDFLTVDLDVPPCHITNLRNSSASRTRIIKEIQALRDNDKIKPGSPILIYFAGHGGVDKASEEWKKRYGSACKIQVIFPYDYDTECEGGKVNCIPDKTIAGLLNDLARVKGDNITVIFDSCHSASANRTDSTEGGRRARSAPVKLAIPADIDDDILPPTSASPSPGGSARHADLPLCSHQTSHTYLAACGSDENAWEEDGKGEFTAALLKQIRACKVDKITYRNLMKELPDLNKQTPHCYGAHQSRILFNACVPSRDIAYIPVVYDTSHHTLTLQAGAASGVTKDSVWEVRVGAAEGEHGIVGRAKADTPNTSSARLIPEESESVQPFWSRCESGNQWKEGTKKLYARQIRLGPGNELKVWFSPEVKRLIFPELEGGAPSTTVGGEPEVGYVHSERDNADIAVELYRPGGMEMVHHRGSASGSSTGPGTEPEVVFHLCNPDAEKYGVAALQQRKPARRADVETVLFAAARWRWHLKRSNSISTPSSMEVEMFKITGRHSDNNWGSAVEEKMKIAESGLVDFEVHERDTYRIRLKNHTKVPLYVGMFYFDTTTFAIAKQFGHVTSNSQADPDVPPGRELIIGDGADGEDPLRFELNEDEALDLGYMKVFWSTEPLELEHLEQDSAFEMKVNSQPRRVAAKRQTGQESQWGSVLLTLVQRVPSGKAT